ncbi:MAG: response regulator receiver [bacterium]|nr:MAG: response regulator receiver [bacterium]KAF0148978.1 MAG: response regulator receiver [bacterium]KAF0168369.1 MAG: response regulator receiver [bacterium]TXT21033.1 MAG: response regulator receiver [bacterium]
MPKLERILCVEDDPDIQAVIQLALETVGGFTVELCASGRAALAKVAGFQPDLILLDVMMPGLDGPATLAALRALPEAAALPVFFMTAKVQSDELDHFLSLGALAVIAKPFDPMTLAQDIRAHWQAHHGG